MHGWIAPAASLVPAAQMSPLPDAAALLHAVNTWGTPALGVLLLVSAAGVPLPVEYAVVAVGALSVQAGGPNAFGVLVVGTASATAGDSIDYALGRLGAARLRGWVARRWARWRRRRAAGSRREVAPPRLHAKLLQRRGMAVMLTRFVFAPASTPMSLFAGATGYAFLAFVLWDACGEAIYVGGNLTLGRVFGPRLLEPGWQMVLLWSLVAVVSLLPVLLIRWLAVEREPVGRTA
jgi:membrane protein DedA with SNARE-associated domain